MPIDKDKGIQAAMARMLNTVEKKVNPAHTALVVVDMQNDFLAKGGAFDKEGVDLSMMQAITPKLVKFIDSARAAGVTVVYIQSIYYAENNWFLSDVWLEHHIRTGKGKHYKYPICEKGAWGADFYGGIKPLPGEIIVNKHRYSAFIETDLDLVLRSRGIRTLVMTGVASDICVAMTAKVGFFKDYYIVFLKDLSATLSLEAHNNVLKDIDMFYGQVLDSSEVLKYWPKK
ncbi:MAG: isochorismatase family cysteine hydrolase [Chloroflexota bacterium]|nr:isochorismatase family cysteine hydrolase [Chloroflexota bacterium]